jgi:acetyl-CoA acetyltransferase
MSLFKGKVAIVGIGEVPSGKFPERHCLQNALEACKAAILDSGIDKEEIDTIIPTGTFFDRRYNTDMVFSKLVEELGLLRKTKNNFQVFAGGSSSSVMLKTACGLVAAGLAKVVLCVQSDKVGSSPTQQMIDLFATFGIPEEWETPFGFFMAAQETLCNKIYAQAQPQNRLHPLVSMKRAKSKCDASKRTLGRRSFERQNGSNPVYYTRR